MTGLACLNNRYHDPTLGTFISVDPLVTTTWEPYTYASANPATLSDRDGLCPVRYDGMRCSSAPKSPCIFSGNVCGYNGAFYGNVKRPPAGTGAVANPGALPTHTVVPAMQSPACASLGPDASSCISDVAAQVAPSGTGTGAASTSLLGILAAKSLLFEVASRAVCWIGGVRRSYGQAGPGDIDRLAVDELIGWAHPTAVYQCGSSASGAAITCVDSQRIPSLQAADAVTLGHYVFCQDRCSSDRLLAHGFVHVRQWELNGDAMAASYLFQTALNGYRANPYEVEAYNVQRHLRSIGWGS